jgi:hypothetical protein
VLVVKYQHFSVARPLIITVEKRYIANLSIIDNKAIISLIFYNHQYNIP